MSKFHDYCPPRSEVEEYQAFLESPGYNLGIFLGDEPPVSKPALVVSVFKGEKIPGGLAQGKKPSEFDQKQLAAGIKVEMEHTTDRAVAQEIALDHLTEDPKYYKKLKKIEKALPRKDKEEKPVKRRDAGGASKKQAGKNGKTRYSYPGEKGGDKKNKPQGQQQAQPEEEKKPAVQDPVQVPKEPSPKDVDPAELANQLQISVNTLTQIAKRFQDNEKLKGREGFVKFMMTRLKDVVEKHRLDADYFGMVFDKLTGGAPVPK